MSTEVNPQQLNVQHALDEVIRRAEGDCPPGLTPAEYAACLRRTPPKTPRPTPTPRVASPLMTELIESAVNPQELTARIEDLISEGTPIVQAARDEQGNDLQTERIVTFLYRNGEAQQVLLFVNRITDEKDLGRSLMERIEGTDWWHLSFQMETNWRASYCFVPALPGGTPPWLNDRDQVQLRRVLDTGLYDTNNPLEMVNRLGHHMSVVQLEHAPVHEFVLEMHELEQLPEYEWHMAPEQHPVSIQRVGDPAPEAPLVIFFDGEAWLRLGLLETLQRAHDASRLPSFNALFVDSGGRERRWKELDGSNPIGAYLADQALPWLAAEHNVAPARENIFLNGQSLGGLSALLAVLSRPEAFGGAFAQSSSLWQEVAFERLAELKDADELHRLNHLRLDIEVGQQEWILTEPHEKFIQQLRESNADISYTVFNGGHDYACWRGAIVPALERILPANSVAGE